MNLVKLLKVGRSLKEGKTVFGKYKLTQLTLPKFASTVRPSGSAPTKNSLLAKSTPVEAIVPIPEVIEVAKPIFVLPLLEAEAPAVAICILEKTQKIPTGTVLRRVEEMVLKKDKITLTARITTKISGWKKKLVPVRSRRKSGATPVQTEWALGQVTVVRNDLTDADLEVVSSKRAVQMSADFANPNTVKNSGRKWIKMTTELFKSNSPFQQKTSEKFENSETKSANRPELAGRI